MNLFHALLNSAMFHSDSLFQGMSSRGLSDTTARQNTSSTAGPKDAGPSFLLLVVAIALALGTSLVSHAEIETIIDNGPSSNRVDMFILGDG